MPHLNENGLVYFIHYGDYWDNEYGTISSHSISIPFLSEKEAEEHAKIKVSDLKWE